MKLGNVLVIDDDFTSRYLVQSLLTSMGIGGQILTATNGLEALVLLKEHCGTAQFPELILLDIKMPTADGFDFLEGLSTIGLSNLANTKIAILSYFGSRRYREMAKLYPVCAYFQKPLTQEKLQEIFAAS